MDDLIKRQDALELVDWYDHNYSEIESYLDIIREDIESLPSAWSKDGGGKMSRKKIAFETYTLVLKHSVWDGEEEHELEEPIVVKHMTDLSLGNPTYMINEMMEKMKHELLLRFAR